MKVALELRPCVGRRSGVGTYTCELAKRLKPSAGMEFEGNLFTFPLYGGRRDLPPLAMPVRTFPVPYGIYYSVWDRLPVPYRLLFPSGADVTHFFNYIVPPGVKGRVIDTIHDLSYLICPETLDSRNLKRISANIERSVERSDAIVTVSENTRRDIVSLLGVPEEKIRVIYNGVSPFGLATPAETLRAKFGLPRDYILYVGNLEPRKNVERLIRAYAKLKREAGIPHRLVLAGQKGWLYDGIFRAVGDEKLEDDVLFTDYVGEADKAALYRDAALFVFPSLYEGFGIPPLEAMAAGTPVACSNASSLPEVTGGAALLFDPTDTDAMAQAMYRLLTDRELREAKISLGKTRAARFSWDRSAAELMELYRSLSE